MDGMDWTFNFIRFGLMFFSVSDGWVALGFDGNCEKLWPNVVLRYDTCTCPNLFVIERRL